MRLTDDGWFILDNGGDCIPTDVFEIPYEVEILPEKSGYVDFSEREIPDDYMTLRRSPETLGIRVADGQLRIRGGNSLASKYNVGYLARRQQHFSYDFTTKMFFEPGNYCHMAGVACYYNYDNYYYCRLSRYDDGLVYMEVVSSENKEIRESERLFLEDFEGVTFVKAQVRGETLQFFCSIDGGRYLPVGGELDMRVLSDERIDWNGFTGAMVGVCCQDLGGDGCEAVFDYLNYKPVGTL